LRDLFSLWAMLRLEKRMPGIRHAAGKFAFLASEEFGLLLRFHVAQELPNLLAANCSRRVGFVGASQCQFRLALRNLSAGLLNCASSAVQGRYQLIERELLRILLYAFRGEFPARSSLSSVPRPDRRR
jgi:hypothetical protein